MSATAEEPFSPHLEVTEYTKHYLHTICQVGVMFVLLHITINAMYYVYEIKVKHLFAA